MGLPFVFLCAACGALYASVLPFVSTARELFLVNYNVTSAAADASLTAFGIASVIATLLTGVVLDWLGGQAIAMVLSGIGYTCVHIVVLSMKQPDPIAVCVSLGVFYGITAVCVWPLVAATIPAAHLGVAYGILVAVQDFALGIVVVVVANFFGRWPDRSHTLQMSTDSNLQTAFFASEVTFLVVALAATLTSAWLAWRIRDSSPSLEEERASLVQH